MATRVKQRRRVRGRAELEPRNVQGILTVAPEMDAFFRSLEKAARSEAAVLIRGETGTGKELAARALHALSRRREQRFEALNCATLTPEMMASEIFGHVKGAFTGAIRDRRGLLRIAHKGTFFLDEIAELPLDIQARLLRVLQEKSFVPLGGSERVEVDVRMLSATHQALRDAVAERRFREDLMYRVRVIPIYLPALRERTGDVEMLTWAFIDEFNKEEGDFRIEGIDEQAFDALMAHDWPGNVRELRNTIEYAVVMAESPVLTLQSLPPDVRGELPPSPKHRGKRSERDRIVAALEAAGGHRGRAAERLNISRSTLWRKIRELRIPT